jgi:hypothetical protein
MTIPRECGNPEREALAEKHAALLHEIAAFLPDCYVIDLNRHGPVYDEEFHRHFFLNGHMNACGYRLKAELVASYMDYIIRHNPDDFRQVSFIGTPYEFR